MYICNARIAIQRVSHASATINQQEKSFIDTRYLILLGTGKGDTEEGINWLVKRIAGLRIFDDEVGVMNRNIMDINGEILIVSQFIPMASCRKGNRPSWVHAVPHKLPVPLYNRFYDALSEAMGKPVSTGEFGVDVKVELLNNGPVTTCMDIRDKEQTT